MRALVDQDEDISEQTIIDFTKTNHNANYTAEKLQPPRMLPKASLEDPSKEQRINV